MNQSHKFRFEFSSFHNCVPAYSKGPKAAVGRKLLTISTEEVLYSRTYSFGCRAFPSVTSRASLPNPSKAILKYYTKRVSFTIAQNLSGARRSNSRASRRGVANVSRVESEDLAPAGTEVVTHTSNISEHPSHLWRDPVKIILPDPEVPRKDRPESGPLLYASVGVACIGAFLFGYHR